MSGSLQAPWKLTRIPDNWHLNKFNKWGDWRALIKDKSPQKKYFKFFRCFFRVILFRFLNFFQDFRFLTFSNLLCFLRILFVGLFGFVWIFGFLQIILWFLQIFLDFFTFFLDFWDLLRSLLKLNEITTEHKKWFFFSRKKSSAKALKRS